jgi:heme exporter protein C
MTYGKGIRPLSVAAAITTAVAAGLIFFYAPLDADQGFSQKIFYLHVPMALVALAGFIAAGVMGALHLRSGRRTWDLRSYVAIHLSIIFGVGVLATGSIWGKAAWGHWWRWDEPVLVSFLIVFLLYCVYFPLRFSIDDPDRQARYSSVFAVVAGAFVPLNFIAVRLAEQVIHPRTFSQAGVGLPAEMLITFAVALIAMALLFLTLWKLELSAKHAAQRLRQVRARLELRAERNADAAALGAGLQPAGGDTARAIATASARPPTA